MDSLAMGAALAAMTADGDRRYEGTLMLSALPDAPTVSDRHRLAERARVWRARRAGRPALARVAAPTSAPSRTRGRGRPTAEVCRPCPELGSA